MWLMQLKAYPLDLNIIQVYAHDDDLIIEEFYEQLETLIKLTKKNEVTLIIGDLNAKVGNGRISDVAVEEETVWYASVRNRSWC